MEKCIHDVILVCVGFLLFFFLEWGWDLRIVIRNQQISISHSNIVSRKICNLNSTSDRLYIR